MAEFRQGTRTRKMYIQRISAQETAKHRAKFGLGRIKANAVPRVLCLTRAACSPIATHKIFPLPPIAGPQNCGPGCCSTPSTPLMRHWVWLTSVARSRCSNEAKTRSSLKFAGVPQTPEPISAVSGPKFTTLWEHVKNTLLFNGLFSDCRYVPSLWRYRPSPTNLCDGAQMTIFYVLCFSASRVQHISDMRAKFALRPHHV